MITRAGFVIDEEFGPECDLPPDSAACVMVAIKDSDLVQISLYNAGDDPGGLGIARADRSIVRVIAEAD